MSIDFRAIPQSYYDDTYTHLPSGYVPFRRGTYYRSSEDADEPLALPEVLAGSELPAPEHDEAEAACTEFQLDFD